MKLYLVKENQSNVLHSLIQKIYFPYFLLKFKGLLFDEVLNKLNEFIRKDIFNSLFDENRQEFYFLMEDPFKDPIGFARFTRNLNQYKSYSCEDEVWLFHQISEDTNNKVCGLEFWGTLETSPIVHEALFKSAFEILSEEGFKIIWTTVDEEIYYDKDLYVFWHLMETDGIRFRARDKRIFLLEELHKYDCYSTRQSMDLVLVKSII